MKSNVLSFSSRYIPPMTDAIIVTAPQVAAMPVQADEPPPIPAEALEAMAEARAEERNTLSFADIRTAAAENIREAVRAGRARPYYRGRRRSNRNPEEQQPRIIVARFPGTCAETGNPIAAGEPILWKPGSRLVYCAVSNRYTEFALQERAQ